MSSQKLKKIPGHDLNDIVNIKQPKKKALKKKVKTKPKLRYKIKYKNILIIFAILLILTLLMIKIFTTKIKNIYITGNSILSDQEIIDLAGIRNYPNTFINSSNQIKNKISKNVYINSVKVKKSNFMKTIKIKVTENKPVFYYLINNKTILSNKDSVDDIYQLPTLINQVPDEVFNKFVEVMGTINNDILSRISEIKYVPNEVDEELFLFTMNDQNSVYVNIHNLNKMNNYLEILKTFNNKKGILHLDSGDYFEIME